MMRRLLCLTALLLACATPAAAQVAFVNPFSVYSAGTSTLTIPSVTAGSNGTIAVGCTVRDTGTVTCGTPLFGGSATGVSTFQAKLVNGGVATTVYCFANVSGTASITLAVSDNTVPSMAEALVFSGGDTATPCTGVQSTNTNGLTATATPAVTTCTASGMGFDFIGHRDDTVTLTSTQTSRANLPVTSQGSVQERASTMAGSTSMTLGYTGLASGSFNHIAGCIAAAAGGAAAPSKLPLVGIGAN